MVEKFSLETEVGTSVEVEYSENNEDYMVKFSGLITRAELIEITEEIKKITGIEDRNITN